eukprot:TRINITY_DN2582_c1_g1_i1.p1 TRINITY_DN2582_c1_g1~~TRINITY_DN2582_c1_g1_i1.p1  ORF type:complete len:755 (+),score=116.05 TRINITY_DN2582_c1_g1_i1:131-2395(+)
MLWRTSSDASAMAAGAVLEQPAPSQTRSRASSDGSKSTLMQIKERRISDATIAAQEGRDLAWVRQFLERVWPQADDIFDGLIREKVENAVGRAFTFEHVKLGKAYPTFFPIEVINDHSDSEAGIVEFRVGVSYQADSQIAFSMGGIRGGISRVNVIGSAHLILGPIISEPPFILGAKVFFANPPDVQLIFSGLLNIAHCPGLEGMVQSAVKSSISKICVLPNRISKTMSRDADKNSRREAFEAPIGVLRVRVVRGWNLPAKDIGILSASTSDPYVKCVSGEQVLKTPVVKKNLNPEWNEAEATADFLVYSMEQWVSFYVFDKDTFTADDDLGSAERLSVRSLLKAMDDVGEAGDIVLPLSEDGRANGGQLIVHVTYSKVLAPSLPVEMQGGQKFLMRVHLSEAALDSDAPHAKPPYRVRASVLSATVTSAPSEKKHAIKSNLAKALQPVVTRLRDEKKMEANEIAELLGLPLDDVATFLASKDDSPAARAQRKILGATNPRFRGSMYLALETLEGKVTLELLDREHSVVGLMRVPLASIVNAGSEGLQGPFMLGEPTEAVGQAIELHCAISAIALSSCEFACHDIIPASQSCSDIAMRRSSLHDDAELKAEMGRWLLGRSVASQEIISLQGDASDDPMLKENTDAWLQANAELQAIAGLAGAARALFLRIGRRLEAGEEEYERRYPSKRSLVKRLRQHNDARRRAVRFMLVKRWKVLKRRCSAIHSAVSFGVGGSGGQENVMARSQSVSDDGGD